MMQMSLPEHTPLLPGHMPLGRRPRLLIVDDQPVNIQALHRVFAADCQVLMATAGERALQLCRERQPDLVLLDVQMPGMDGHELCCAASPSSSSPRRTRPTKRPARWMPARPTSSPSPSTPPSCAPACAPS